MKEIQIPRKNMARSSDLVANKRLKDPDLKNRKFAEKRQSTTFSDVSVESTKDPISQISAALSDSDAESFMQGSSLDLLSTPEICLLTDESQVSTITNKDYHASSSSTDRIQSIADLPVSVQSLRAEINELKKLICSVDTFEESHWIDGVVVTTGKLRVVALTLVLWAVLAAIVVFVRSGEEVAYYGPYPT
ncbi:unnamed protein product [Cochlearia groenlandica]